MQTLTYEMAKGAAILFEQGHPAMCEVHVGFNDTDADCILLGLIYDSTTARVVRNRDGRNGEALFCAVKLTDEDAARCLQAYRNDHRAKEEAEVFHGGCKR